MFLRRRSPAIPLLVVLAAVGPLSIHIVLPSIPSTARDLAVPTAAIQASLTVFVVMMAVGQLVYGPLSDRWGRRRPLLFGLVLYLAGCIACALARDATMLQIGRLLQGMGGCAGVVLARAMVRDLHDGDGATKALSHIAIGVSFAPIVAPILGGQIDVWFGWRASFAILGVAALLILTFVWPVQETLRTARPSNGFAGVFRDLLALLRIRRFSVLLGSLAASSVAFFIFITSAPVLMLEGLGYGPDEYGLFYLSVPFSFMAGNFVGGRTAARFGPHRQIVISVVAAAVAAAGSPVWIQLDGASALALFGPFALLTLAQGFAWPAVMGLALGAEPTRAGSASGLLGFTQMTSAAIATLVAGLFGAASAFAFSLTVAAFAIVAALAYLLGSARRPVR
jgi:DHA1 family bicyclomycin/chloramphenicol resistance-like MFS transporter